MKYGISINHRRQEFMAAVNALHELSLEVASALEVCLEVEPGAEPPSRAMSLRWLQWGGRGSEVMGVPLQVPPVLIHVFGFFHEIE